MVAHTKKSRNIRHKTLKHRTVDETKIVGGVLGIPPIRASEKAKKELPTFDSFYALNPTDEAIKDKLYKIFYVDDPTAKYDFIKTNKLLVGKGKTNIGNFRMYCKNADTEKSKIFKDEKIKIDNSSNNYIAFEFVTKPTDEIITTYPNIVTIGSIFYLLIFESLNCKPGVDTTSNICEDTKDKAKSPFFSHFIISPVMSETVADLTSRDNISDTLSNAAKSTVLGAETYRDLFKNELFIDYLSDDFKTKFQKKYSISIDTCKKLSSKGCSDLNEYNAKLKIEGQKSVDQFKLTDFKNPYILRLLFLIKYQYKKAIELGRINMLSIIFHMFKEVCLNTAEKQSEFKKSDLKILSYFAKFPEQLQGLYALTGAIASSVRNNTVADAPFTQKDVAKIVEAEKENETKKSLKGGAPNKVDYDKADNRFDEVKKIKMTNFRLFDINYSNVFITLLNKYINPAEFDDSTVFDEDIQIILVGAFISFVLEMCALNEFTTSFTNKEALKTNYNEIKEKINAKTPVSSGDFFIFSLIEILDKYYPHVIPPSTPPSPQEIVFEIVFNILELQQDKPPEPIPIVVPPIGSDASTAIAVAIAATSTATTSPTTSSIASPPASPTVSPTEEASNPSISSPMFNPVDYINKEHEYYEKKQELIKKIITFISNSDTVKNKSSSTSTSLSKINLSLYMMYDFQDIVDYFEYKNSQTNNVPMKIFKKKDTIVNRLPGFKLEKSLDTIIDNSFFIQYTLLVEKWVKGAVNYDPTNSAKDLSTLAVPDEIPAEIYKFMNIIAGCICNAVDKIRTTGLSFALSLIVPIPVLSSILSPTTGQAILIVVRTVIAEWLDEKELKKFADPTLIHKAENQRKAITDAKQADKKVEEIKQEEEKTPLYYIQFDPNFQLTFIYKRSRNSDNKFVYSKFQINADNSTVDTKEIIDIKDIIDYLQHGKVEVVST